MQQKYIPIGNNLFQSEATGLIHCCKSGREIFELLRLTRPFESDETQKIPAVKLERIKQQMLSQ